MFLGIMCKPIKPRFVVKPCVDPIRYFTCAVDATVYALSVNAIVEVLP